MMAPAFAALMSGSTACADPLLEKSVTTWARARLPQALRGLATRHICTGAPWVIKAEDVVAILAKDNRARHYCPTIWVVPGALVSGQIIMRKTMDDKRW